MGKEQYSGGAVIAHILKQEGVEKVFGIIDGTYFGFYSSVVKEKMQLLTPRHETNAAHMAGAYARVTGRLGVCMASNGPGVANILPGLVIEQAEGNRVLVITSSRRTGVSDFDRRGSYQQFDQVGVISKIAKYSIAVPSFERIPEIMRMALRFCYSGRPGVVHVDIPENIMNQKVAVDLIFLQPKQYRQTNPIIPDPRLVSQAAKLLAKAKFPIIHAGSGVIHAQAYQELQELASALHAPVTTSWAGRGSMVETLPLGLGIPMIDIKLNNKLRNKADVVLILGSRVGETDWWGKAPYWAVPSKQKTIQVDIDELNFGANKPIELAILADIKLFLLELSKELVSQKVNIKARENAFKPFIKQHQAFMNKLNSPSTKKLQLAHTGKIIAEAQETLPDDTIVVADGGNTAVWANFYWQIRKPGTLLSTFKFGMLGAGIAQALGAQAAFSKRKVCCLIGDGAMGFHPQEIETAVRHKLNVLYIVFCDKQWGMVKINQSFTLKPIKTLIYKKLDPGETISADLGEIRFDLLAQSMGAYGERVSKNEDIKPAIIRAVKSQKPAVIHVDVDPVVHMWAPGLIHFKDMHLEPKGK